MRTLRQLGVRKSESELTRLRRGRLSSRIGRPFALGSRPFEERDAGRWYNERVTGLGDDFRAELIAGIERIAEGPKVWPTNAHDRRTRSYLLQRFPYSIVYVVGSDGGVVVAAVAHAKRRPGYWRGRVE